MKKILILAALLIGSPAFATDYLIQQPGDTNATGLWIGKTAPVPGVDCPAGSKVSVYAPRNGDAYIGNYKLDAQSKQVYAPPVKEIPVVDPTKASPIVVDTTIKDAARTADDATFLKLLRVKFSADPTQAELDAAKAK